MPDNRRDYEKELDRIFDAAADAVEQQSEEEWRADLLAHAIDPDQYVAEGRQALLAGVKAFKQRHLRKAQRRHAQSVASYVQCKAHLPKTREKRRAAFDRALKRDPGLRQLTIQNRDFTELTDEDIESSLLQLFALDALTDDDLKDE